MSEKVPQTHSREAGLSPEVRKKYEAMTRDEASEKIIESVERAQDLQEQLKEFDRTDEEDNVIHIHDRATWIQAKELSREFKETLAFIPRDVCAKNELPFHPADQAEKIQYKYEGMPEKPDYPTSYVHQPAGASYPERYPRADELAQAG